MKKIIHTKEVPEPIGAYSQAVVHQGLLYVSGQIGLDAKRGLLADTCQAQATLAFQNLLNVLKAANATSDQVIKMTIYLTDMQDFQIVDQVMREYIEAPFPARAAVAVSGLPKGALVELEALVGLR